MLFRVFRLVLICIFLVWLAGGCRAKLFGLSPNDRVGRGAEEDVAGDVYPLTENRPPESASSRSRPDTPQLLGTVLAVIENSPMARPQAGLGRADLVYETLAEGGITRFLAVYYTEPADKIGPIRSARYYFVEIAKAYGAPFAHAGGNEDALALIRSIRLRDVDEIFNAGGYFWRSPDRRPPHNLYTSTDQLVRAAKSKGFPMVPLVSLPTGQAPGGEDSGEVHITFYRSDAYTSTSQWTYRDGAYWKSTDGLPHYLEGGEQISADNVIVMASRMRDEKKEDWQLDIRVVGEGEALFFSGGKVFSGTWRKKSRDSHLEFFRRGTPMKFAPGRTWIEIVPGLNAVSYQTLPPSPNQ